MLLKYTSLFVFIFSFGISLAQDTIKTEDKISFEVHGFIKTDYWYDSRQVVYAREGLFTLFPKDVNYDKDGNDINAASSFNFSAITSRVNLAISGPDALGAKTIGFIEADFSGMSNVSINTFRLRHAYLRLDWQKSSLLLGQYWHPMFVTEVFPTVISLNTGSPFQPFIRSPQIRFTHYLGRVKLIAAALSQRDYANSGPMGRSYSYMSNSLMPNFHLQLQYQKKRSTIGFAADYKVLKPRIHTDSNLITNSTISSLSYMAYYKWKGNNFEIKAKAILGENLTDNLLLGGYAVASIDSATDERSYTPTQHIFTWVDFLYHKKFKRFSVHPGLFIGYASNLGTKADNVGIYYSTGADIDNMYRIAPSLSFRVAKTMFSLEWEYTKVYYGQNNDQGLVTNTHSVANNRILFTAFYFF